jgi:hypothetical protein
LHNYSLNGTKPAAIALLFMAMISSSAVARPQDEVMSSAYGCAGIASTQVWLDCYYGAAQPMRIALGLQPALASQIALNRSPPIGGPEADRDVRNQVMATASQCGASTAGRIWLDCYYSAANPIRALLRLSLPLQAVKSAAAIVKPPPHHINPIATWLGAKDFFVESAMSSYSFDGQGRFNVTLANGQNWRQVDLDRIARWSRAAASYIVTITGGAFGSYNLAIKGEVGIFKVRRAP